MQLSRKIIVCMGILFGTVLLTSSVIQARDREEVDLKKQQKSIPEDPAFLYETSYMSDMVNHYARYMPIANKVAIKKPQKKPSASKHTKNKHYIFKPTIIQIIIACFFASLLAVYQWRTKAF